VYTFSIVKTQVHEKKWTFTGLPMYDNEHENFMLILV
jgi:hypothetical protein